MVDNVVLRELAQLLPRRLHVPAIARERELGAGAVNVRALLRTAPIDRRRVGK